MTNVCQRTMMHPCRMLGWAMARSRAGRWGSSRALCGLRAVGLGNSFYFSKPQSPHMQSRTVTLILSSWKCIVRNEHDYISPYDCQGALKMRIVIITAIASPVITSNDVWISQIFCKIIKDNLLIFAEAMKTNRDSTFIENIFLWFTPVPHVMFYTYLNELLK